MTIRKLDRDGGEVKVLELSKPDLASNRHWFLVATVSEWDYVQTDDGVVTQVKHLSDKRILELLD